MRKAQAVVPWDVVAELLASAGDDLLLIGGQSLAWWMDRYGIRMPAPFSFVSHDVDFLARSASDAAAVHRLAKTLGGYALLPSTRTAAFTSLVGQAIKDLPSGEVYNVDVLHKMWGADRAVFDRAILVPGPPQRFLVLHPLDILKSRVDNLHGLKEKQNDRGEAQLRAAVRMVQAFLRETAANEPIDAKRPTALRYVAFIEKLARAAAGKKVAKRHGIHVADAVEPKVVSSKEFHEKLLPRLTPLMSASRRKEISGRA